MKKRIIYPLIFLIYSLLTVIFTWPLILNLSGSTYGYPGDNFGFIYYLWWWRYSLFNSLDFNFLPLQEAPFGMPILPDSGAVVYFWPAKVLALLFNEVVSFNLNLLLTFPLSGLFTYLLIYKVCRSKLAAFVAGLVFAFSPYHLWRSYNHLDLAMVQYIPLYFWALLNFLERRNLRWGLGFGLAFSLLYLTNFYYAYFGFLATAAFLMVFFLRKVQRRQLREFVNLYFFKTSLVAVFSALLPFFIFVYPALQRIRAIGTSRVGDLLHRPFENLLMFSARPWDYLLPSSDHPLFGKYSLAFYGWIRTLSTDWKVQGAFLHERCLFLGYFSLIFAAFGFLLWLRGKVKSSYFASSLITFLFLLLLSAPPFIFLGGAKIVFPSYFLYPYFPMFRSYTRVGIFVLLSLLVPTSIGFSFLLGRLGRRGRLILTTLASLFVLFEFLNFPPPKVVSFSKIPPAYKWVAEQPGDFVIIEYPRSVNIAEIQMYQRYHKKRFFNLHNLSPNFKNWELVEDIYDPQTPVNLAEFGVKYALVHKKPLFGGPNPVDDLWWTRALKKPIQYRKIPKGLKLVKEFPRIDILEVVVGR